MSRAQPLGSEHAPIVRELREQHPTLSLMKLAPLVSARCGFLVSQSALHRCMEANGIARAGYRAALTRHQVQMLAQRALDVAAARERPALSEAWPPGFERAVHVGDVSAAFHALLFVWAQESGVEHVGQVADAARGWLTEAGS